jgi:hypothetical protein
VMRCCCALLRSFEKNDAYCTAAEQLTAELAEFLICTQGRASVQHLHAVRLGVMGRDDLLGSYVSRQSESLRRACLLHLIKFVVWCRTAEAA